MDYHKKILEIEDTVHRINLLYVNLAKYHSITYAELLVYSALYRHSPCTQTCIVDLWGLPKQTVNKIVKRLEQINYIAFSQGDNKKEKLISITELGKKKMECLLNEIVEVEINALKQLSNTEIDCLSRGMVNFTNAFESNVNHLGTDD